MLRCCAVNYIHCTVVRPWPCVSSEALNLSVLYTYVFVYAYVYVGTFICCTTIRGCCHSRCVFVFIRAVRVAPPHRLLRACADHLANNCSFTIRTNVVGRTDKCTYDDTLLLLFRLPRLLAPVVDLAASRLVVTLLLLT